MENQIIWAGPWNTVQINPEARVTVGDGVMISNFASVFVQAGAELTLGDKVFFNEHCCIRCQHKITVGKATIFGDGVKLYDHNHEYNNYYVAPVSFRKKAITIGDNCWIGANSVILSGVTVGNNVIIGAGCVIRKDIPENSIVFPGECVTIKPRRQAQRHVMVYTLSDQLQHIEYLLENLPEVDFHVACPCYASDQLIALRSHPNFQLYNGILPVYLTDVVERTQLYLDINHYVEVDNILDTMYQKGVPVYAFQNTSHRADPRSRVFPTEEPEAMVQAIREFFHLEDPNTAG